MVRLGALFDAVYGTNMELNACTITNERDTEGISFVSRTSQNNGVSARIKPVHDIAPISAGVLSVAVSGSVLETFLQTNPFYSGRDVYYLSAKPEIQLSERQKLYYCLCIKANSFRYNYGRAANKTLENIELPALDEIPGWVHSFTVPDYRRCKAPVVDDGLPLPDRNRWVAFPLHELFTIARSTTTPLEELELYGAGKYPYVTTQAVNNGVGGYYNHYTESGGVLTVDSAVLGYVSYQPMSFSASDHVEKLIPRFSMSKYMALFFVAVLNEDQFRYNYGRKCSKHRLQTTIVKLPAKGSAPDFHFMDQYIKSLPFSSVV